MTAPAPSKLAQFLASGATSDAVAGMSGNTPWAHAYAQGVRELIRRQADRAPRSQQVHVGPSELGVACDRQVVSKFLGLPRTNHVNDPWPSIVGTAVHAWLADAFVADDPARWMTEHRVVPHPDHAGTGDLYDRSMAVVGDHKVLGDSSMAKVRRPEGPPRKYQRQLLLYALGFLREGLPVQRVALLAYPRTRSTLTDLYVWERAFDGDAVRELSETFTDTARRKEFAGRVTAGMLRVEDVPRQPSHDECYFCPFYRPQTAHLAGQPGCPGTVTK